MTGQNELIMNQATAIKAWQFYLDSLFKEGAAPTVTRVESNKSSSDFTLYVSDEKPDDPV